MLIDERKKVTERASSSFPKVFNAEAHAAAAKAGLNELQCCRLIIGELFLCWTCFKSR